MAELEVKNLNSPEETRPFVDKGKVDIVKLAGGAVGKGTFEPGWKWSDHIKPIAETDSCQSTHMGYMVSGRMKVVMDNGSEAEVGPGDVFMMPPGHDAWIVGDEPCELIDFGGMENYAKGS